MIMVFIQIEACTLIKRNLKEGVTPHIGGKVQNYFYPLDVEGCLDWE